LTPAPKASYVWVVTKPEERLPWWSFPRLGEAGVRICSALDGSPGMTTAEIVDHPLLFPSNDRTVQTALTQLHKRGIVEGARDPNQRRRFIWKLLQ